MKQRKLSWLLYCLIGIMAIGIIAVFTGCPDAETEGPTTYKVTIDPDITGGTVSANPTSGTRNTKITVTVTPDQGNLFVPGSLKYGNTPIAMTGLRTGEFNLTSNVTITADFSAKPTPTDDPPGTKYTVTISPTTNGTVTIASASEGIFDAVSGVFSGELSAAVLLIIAPASGHRLQAGSLKYNGIAIEAIGLTGLFYLPEEDVEITAEFEPIPVTSGFTVTIDPSIINGTVTASPAGGARGQRIDLTVTPDDGYRLKAGSLKRGNSLSSMTTTISNNRFNMPESNVFVTAIFELSAFKKPDYSIYKAELDAIIADMDIMEKIGQMTQAERGQLSHPGYAAQIKNNFLGSVLSGGESGPGSGPPFTSASNNGNTSPLQWWTYTNEMLEASMSNEPRGNLQYGIPYVYGIDAVHGHANAIHNPTVFPHNIAMGAIYVGDPEAGKKAAYDAGKVTATEMYATGHRFNFNPVLGVGENSRWGRMYESYSQNPLVVAAMGAEYVKGLQWDYTVGACGKHYGFEGQVTQASSTGSWTAGNAVVGGLSDPENLAKIEPYHAAIDAGLLSVMTFYGSVNGTKPVRYKELLDILKVDWGFEGFIITDWSDMGTSSANIVSSIKAGVDMTMAASGGEWSNFISVVKTAYDNGDIEEDRINDAVYRILLFKKVFGILDDPVVPESNPFPNGSDEHRQVARDIAAQTLVLLKNNNDIVGELKNKTKILLTGDASAHVGYQCGGWTRAWQGVSNTPTIPNFKATNIHDGMLAALGSNVTIVRSANGTTGVPAGFEPDVVIAVAAERPYAEGSGDTTTPGLGGTGVSVTADAAMLNTVHSTYGSVPKVLIVLSGRPVNLTTSTGSGASLVTRDNNALFDGIIAAWQPGSEAGDAIADVLFGNKDFVGRTPFTWRTAPVTGDEVYPYGYGLKKGQTQYNQGLLP